MEKYFRKMLDMAESIGSIETASMDGWVPGKDRICFTGKTENGADYVLELVVGVENHDS